MDRLFLGGPAPCPICGTILRKANFVSQKFEDLRVEKEIQIRIKLAQVYVRMHCYADKNSRKIKTNLVIPSHNKRLEDFKGDLRAYNDYLEEVEEICKGPILFLENTLH